MQNCHSCYMATMGSRSFPSRNGHIWPYLIFVFNVVSLVCSMNAPVYLYILLIIFNTEAKNPRNKHQKYLEKITACLNY